VRGADHANDTESLRTRANAAAVYCERAPSAAIVPTGRPVEPWGALRGFVKVASGVWPHRADRRSMETRNLLSTIIPARAGPQSPDARPLDEWPPAFAGMAI